MRRILCALLIELGVIVMSSHPAFAHETHSGFASALLSAKANPELGEAASLYDWLIGDWDVRVVDYAKDGTRVESHGEWHFAWVLEGRAVQDVWIDPPRPQRKPDMSRKNNRYGTTLRSFDPNDRTWKVIWINPVTGAHEEFVAQRVGKDIVQAGRDAQGNPMRWVFTDIRTDSFRWFGERSQDHGHSWTLEAEFFARRL
jgi:hypothetical protein